MTTALAVQPDARPVTPDELALIKNTVAVGATDQELKLFLFDCARQGVHPLDKLIHFTKRSGKYTPITSIDFMRIRAADSGEMAGSDDPVFDYFANGAVAITTKPDDPPVQATVTVYRITQGQRFAYTATARWAEYKPDTNDFMWRKMPHTMLGKCAEALALRKGFPRQLAGLYAKEEMDQAEASALPEKRENTSAPNVEGSGTTHPTDRANSARSYPPAAIDVEVPAATTTAGTTIITERRLVAGNEHEKDGDPVYADVQIDTRTGEELPPGFALIDDYRPDGDWHHVTWGRDAQGGWTVYKTKLAKVANKARVAFNDRVPVKLHSKKFPFLDAVERLDDDMTPAQIKATKWTPAPAEPNKDMGF